MCRLQNMPIFHLITIMTNMLAIKDVSFMTIIINNAYSKISLYFYFIPEVITRTSCLNYLLLLVT